MAWAEGSLWVGSHRNRKIHRVDRQTGAIMHTIPWRLRELTCFFLAESTHWILAVRVFAGA
jgi:hypothetical protein